MEDIWNSNLLSSLIGVIIGALLTIFINIINNKTSEKKKRKTALKILETEFDKIKNAIPGLTKSFESNFDLMINAGMISPPFDAGSFNLLYPDLLSLKEKKYKKLYKFYSKVEQFHKEYIELLSAKKPEMKTVYGLMVKNSLSELNEEFEKIDELLSKN